MRTVALLVQILLLGSISHTLGNRNELNGLADLIDSIENADISLNEGAIQIIAEFASKEILHNLILPSFEQSANIEIGNDEKIPVLPIDIPDPINLPIPEIFIPINLEGPISDIVKSITGNLTVSSLTIFGGSSVADNLEIVFPVLTVNYTIGFDELRNLIGFETYIEVLTTIGLPGFDLIRIEGLGDLVLNVTGGAFDITITIDTSDKLDVTTFYAGLDIEAISFAPTDLDVFSVTLSNGNHIILAEETFEQLSAIATTAVKDLFATNRDEINETIRELLNALIGECTFHDIVDGDLSCAGIGTPRPSTAPAEPDTEPPEDAGSFVQVQYGLLPLSLFFLAFILLSH